MSSNSTVSQSLLHNDGPFYIEVNLQDILYGVELCLYIMTMHTFVTRGTQTRQKSDIFYAVYSTVMLGLLTVWVASDASFGEKQWLEEQNYPGGPGVWAQQHAHRSALVAAGAASVIIQQMTDGLMIFRYRVVWNSRRAVIVPAFLSLTTLAVGLVLIWAVSTPGVYLFTGTTAKLGLAYYTISVFLHATLTTLICWEILRHARSVKQLIGEEHAAPYFSAVMVLVESVLPCTLTGIAYLTAFGLKSPVETALQGVYITMMCISPQMLILRVAQGIAWNDTTRPAASVVRFSPGSGSSAPGTGVHVESSSSDSPSESRSAKHDEV